MSLRPLNIDVSDLWQNANKSSLKATVNSGSSFISVYSITAFTINQIIQIGDFGEANTEIIKTHGSTAPTGFVVTLAANTTKNHAKDTPVYIIPYNQIEISHSVTETGTKTVLTGFPKNINPEQKEIVHNDSQFNSGYYFTRYKETIDNTFSDYSDPIPYTGYPMNTVGYLIYGTLALLQKELSETLTYDMLIRSINDCLMVRRGKLKRWSNYQQFDYVVGQLSRGDYKIALPADYYDKNSRKSCLSLRIGSNKDLSHIDKREFNELMQSVTYTTVATQAEIGDTTLVLTDTSDLDTAGSVDVYINENKYTIDYTANNTTTNTLSGIVASGTGSITATLLAGAHVWTGASEKTKDYFSIWDGYIHFAGPIEDSEARKNIYMDYYTDIVQVDSDMDVITGVKYHQVGYWLRWEVRNITENQGKRDMQDGDFLLFTSMLNDEIRRESSGQKYKRAPKISGITYDREYSTDFDRN